MKKFLSVLIFLLFISSTSYGAASEDVYLRRDVFEAKMDALMAEIRLGNEQIRREIQDYYAKTREEIQAHKAEIHDEIQKYKAETHEGMQILSTRIEALENKVIDSERHTLERHEDLKTMIYWGFSILGLFIAFAIFGPSFGEFLKNLRKPSISVDEIKELIANAIAEAQLNGRPQV